MNCLGEPIIKKIQFSRYLYYLAEDNIKSDNPINLSAGVMLLQDSVEVFLLALAEHLGASITDKMDFDKYFVAINEKIKPRELPLKSKLLQVNKLRVSAKHYALQPAKDECGHLLNSVSDFFEDVSTQHFGQSYFSIDLLDIINGEILKELLVGASDAFSNGDYNLSKINCRKAIYLVFLHSYSIEEFKNPIKRLLPHYLTSFLRAPIYARTEEYMESHVNDPLDYLVIDKSDLDIELTKCGINHRDFDNLIRMTPAVYRTITNEWVVREEFDAPDKEHARKIAEYVLNTTIDIILQQQRSQSKTKYSISRVPRIKLVDSKVCIYHKADRNSKVVFTMPAGEKMANCSYRVRGLNDNDTYWFLYLYHTDPEDRHIFGYIHNDDVVEIIDE